MIRLSHVGALSLGLLTAAAAAQPAAAPAAPVATQRCQAFGDAASKRAGLKVTSVRHLSASSAAVGTPGTPPTPALPGRCLVEGTLDPHTGADGKVYAIGFALALPDEWNGRFLLQGGGGLNGTVNPPTGPVAAGDRPAISRGFAVISHDSGHKGAGFDNSFMKDQRAALDFAESSVRTVTLAGKAMTEAFYGRPIGHSYMTGCSTGGRESMLAAQRYPELFDGIVVGAPAMRTGISNLAIEYSTVQFNQGAPRDAKGVPQLDRFFTAADRKTLVNGLLAQCDMLDGRPDGMIMNVAGCHFRPAALKCARSKTNECLSAAQVASLERAFAGPKDAYGYPIYVPVPYDTGIVYTGPGLPGYLPSGQPTPFGPSTKAVTIDLGERLHALAADGPQRLTDTNVWTDLDTFLGRGGKILFFHGVSDPWFSANDSWDYWQRAAATNGPAFTDASRYYMIPGMMHCRGGNAYDQFDLLGPMVEWVENHRAPDRPTASRSDGAGSVPLCPHPSYPRYESGDPIRAESYQCRMPAAAPVARAVPAT